MASFPSSVKTFATIVDGADSVLAAHQNERGAEITAIETWLLDLDGWIGRVNTIVDGMKLTWNSATSVTVGVGACYAENGDIINATSAIVKSGLSLSTSTFYHIYVYLSGGTPAAEVVTTTPTAWKSTAYSKTGDTSRRYVGSIKTDGSGNVYQFVHELPANLMHYVVTSTFVSPFRCLSGGTATTGTAVSVAGIIPVTSTVGKFRFINTANQTLSIGFTSTVNATVAIPNGATTEFDIYTTLPINAQNIYYKYGATVGSGGGYVDVLGYQFER